MQLIIDGNALANNCFYALKYGKPSDDRTVDVTFPPNTKLPGPG